MAKINWKFEHQGYVDILNWAPTQNLLREVCDKIAQVAASTSDSGVAIYSVSVEPGNGGAKGRAHGIVRPADMASSVSEAKHDALLMGLGSVRI